MKMKYTLFIVMCFALYVYADNDEDAEMKLLKDFMKYLEQKTGKKATFTIEEQDGKRIVRVFLCDDGNDCSKKKQPEYNVKPYEMYIRLG
nr:venom protein [Lampona murina]